MSEYSYAEFLLNITDKNNKEQKSLFQETSIEERFFNLIENFRKKNLTIDKDNKQLKVLALKKIGDILAIKFKILPYGKEFVIEKKVDNLSLIKKNVEDESTKIKEQKFGSDYGKREIHYCMVDFRKKLAGGYRAYLTRVGSYGNKTVFDEFLSFKNTSIQCELLNFCNESQYKYIQNSFKVKKIVKKRKKTTDEFDESIFKSGKEFDEFELKKTHRFSFFIGKSKENYGIGVIQENEEISFKGTLDGKPKTFSIENNGLSRNIYYFELNLEESDKREDILVLEALLKIINYPNSEVKENDNHREANEQSKKFVEYFNTGSSYIINC